MCSEEGIAKGTMYFMCGVGVRRALGYHEHREYRAEILLTHVPNRGNGRGDVFRSVFVSLPPCMSIVETAFFSSTLFEKGSSRGAMMATLFDICQTPMDADSLMWNWQQCSLKFHDFR